jgi:hypothetical protein
MDPSSLSFSSLCVTGQRKLIGECGMSMDQIAIFVHGYESITTRGLSMGFFQTSVYSLGYKCVQTIR